MTDEQKEQLWFQFAVLNLFLRTECSAGERLLALQDVMEGICVHCGELLKDNVCDCEKYE